MIRDRLLLHDGRLVYFLTTWPWLAYYPRCIRAGVSPCQAQVTIQIQRWLNRAHATVPALGLWLFWVTGTHGDNGKQSYKHGNSSTVGEIRAWICQFLVARPGVFYLKVKAMMQLLVSQAVRPTEMVGEAQHKGGGTSGTFEQPCFVGFCDSRGTHCSSMNRALQPHVCRVKETCTVSTNSVFTLTCRDKNGLFFSCENSWLPRTYTSSDSSCSCAQGSSHGHVQSRNTEKDLKRWPWT